MHDSILNANIDMTRTWLCSRLRHDMNMCLNVIYVSTSAGSAEAMISLRYISDIVKLALSWQAYGGQLQQRTLGDCGQLSRNIFMQMEMSILDSSFKTPTPSADESTEGRT